MKLTSRVKIRACRLNGALSRGPVTEAGKRRSSQNGLSHGLYSRQILLSIPVKWATNSASQWATDSGGMWVHFSSLSGTVDSVTGMVASLATGMKQ